MKKVVVINGKETNYLVTDDGTSLNGLKRTKILKDGLVYSSISKHLIPKFKDEKGVYCFVPTNTRDYEKFYLESLKTL